jgi:beta-glucosidase/6-phospho-beta-glucosidase/beta-galactosidase
MTIIADGRPFYTCDAQNAERDWGWQYLETPFNDNTMFVCRYKPTDLVVTENGVDVPGEFNASFPDVLDDEFRINYFKGYIQAAADAVVEDKVTLTSDPAVMG